MASIEIKQKSVSGWLWPSAGNQWPGWPVLWPQWPVWLSVAWQLFNQRGYKYHENAMYGVKIGGSLCTAIYQ